MPLFTAHFHAHPTAVPLSGVLLPEDVNDVRLIAASAWMLWAVPCALQMPVGQS